MTEPQDRNWMLLLDPERTAATDSETPPVEAVMGGFLIDADGAVGSFEPNPDYVPAGPDSPSDLVDAAARLVLAGRAEPELVLRALSDSVTELAVDAEGAVIVEAAPDGEPCVLVVTGAANRNRVEGAEWRRVDHAELVAALPADVDLLLNPGGPASMRLFADAVREPT